MKSLKSSFYRRIQTTEEMETLFFQNQKQISLDTPYNFDNRRILWFSISLRLAMQVHKTKTRGREVSV